MNLKEIIDTRFGGKLQNGGHDEGCQACIFEAASVAKGIPWTDDPEMVKCWDIRLINDARWSSPELRAKYMIPLMEAYDGSMDWPEERQRAVVEKITINTTNRITAKLPHLADEIREMCRSAKTLEECKTAYAAARAADYADYAYATRVAANAARSAAYAAVYAAYAAAYAADDAAYAADDAAPADSADAVLIETVNIWLEAARCKD